MAPLVNRDKSGGSYRGNNVNYRSATYYGSKTPRGSLGKFRRVVPEVMFRIIHIAADHVKGSLELREQTLEVALGPKGAFENGNVGTLTRPVPAGRVVCAVPQRRRKPKRSKPPKRPKVPSVVRTLLKAREWRRQLDAGEVASQEWRRQLDAGEVASQAAIARREGLTRARVTQIMALLRLAPDIQQSILNLGASPNKPTVQDPARQIAEFQRTIKRRS